MRKSGGGGVAVNDLTVWFYGRWEGGGCYIRISSALGEIPGREWSIVGAIYVWGCDSGGCVWVFRVGLWGIGGVEGEGCGAVLVSMRVMFGGPVGPVAQCCGGGT